MATASPKKGSVVRITFWDHAHNGDGAVKCRVWGKVIRNTKREYTIHAWECMDDDGEHNQDKFHIIKSTITEIVTYEPRSTRR